MEYCNMPKATFRSIFWTDLYLSGDDKIIPATIARLNVNSLSQHQQAMHAVHPGSGSIRTNLRFIGPYRIARKMTLFHITIWTKFVLN